jgi:hypothetical protein
MKNALGIAVFLCVLIAPSIELSAERSGWKEYQSAHFIVFYKEVPLDFVKTVADSAETEYHDIARGLGFTRERNWRSDRRAQIYIYQDDKDYVANAQQYQWSHGAASVREKIIRTFPSAHGFFDSTLPHELGHIIFHDYIGFDVEIPLWFEEGVAMYQEKAKRLGANDHVLDALKNGQFISLTELTNMRLYSDSPPDKVQLFYAESASIVNYMISELGEYRFVKLCRELKSGKSFMGSLESAYVRFSNFEELTRSWVGYLQTRQQ